MLRLISLRELLNVFILHNVMPEISVDFSLAECRAEYPETEPACEQRNRNRLRLVQWLGGRTFFLHRYMRDSYVDLITEPKKISGLIF